MKRTHTTYERPDDLQSGETDPGLRRIEDESVDQERESIADIASAWAAPQPSAREEYGDV